MRTLAREELTAAHAARQLLLERAPLGPTAAIRRLTPLQAQDPPAPFVALAARLQGFSRAALEAAIDRREVVKTTINRLTLHLAAADDYPSYAQLTRQARLRAWRRTYAHLDEEAVTAELGAWLAQPRTNAEIRARVRRYDGVPDDEWGAIVFARILLALVQLPPAGHWSDRSRASFVVDPRPRPDPVDAAAHVLARYLGAFGPASLRDVASWAGVAQRDVSGALARVETVACRDERGVELVDLPGQPLPPASTPLPVRFLSRWDQALLAYEDRERIIPAELRPLRLTLAGDQTVTVDGRVAASWKLERSAKRVRVLVRAHREIRRSARAELRAEALRTAAFCVPEAERAEVAYVS